MQRKMEFKLRSEDEEIKDAGLTIDLDEIARRGVMSKSEKTIAKWYGIYGSRQPGNHMARIVTPGGVMTSSQARNLARVSEKYGQGVLSVTTRQAIQFHWLKLGSLADMIRGLSEEGSTTMHGCGDVTRQVAACPLAETCPYRRLDVRPWAAKLQKYLGDAEDLDNLPRKFKITLSGCSGGCAQPYINCLGLIAVQKSQAGQTVKGFQAIVGGGMGWDPYVGQELFSFIPEDKVLSVARAVALTFRDHGDRFNRATSRLKVVVALNGIEQVRAWVLENLIAEGVDTHGLETATIDETGPNVPDRPLSHLQNFLGTDGKAVVRVLVPKGELAHHQLRRLAELSEIFGDQKVYTNNRQNFELHGVEPEKVKALEAEIHQLGFATDGFFGIRDIVPCVGTTYCPKAVTETRALYDLLFPLVSQEKFKAVEDKVLINITGCPNSCSPYRIVDIGFRGLRIRNEDQGSVEGYEVLLGGDQRAFGRKLGEFKKQDCVQVVESILDAFLKLRTEEETLTQTVTRVGLEPFSQAVYQE
jgi:ferredoxin-nitrite reductase